MFLKAQSTYKCRKTKSVKYDSMKELYKKLFKVKIKFITDTDRIKDKLLFLSSIFNVKVKQK